MKYEEMCKEILSLVGGRENIVRCFNCMTRLRLILAEPDKADVAALKQIKGIIGVSVVSPQLQCIIGPEAGTVCKEFCKIANIEQGTSAEDEKLSKADMQEMGNKGFSLKDIPGKIVDALSNCIQPLLPIIICGSMFKLLCSLLGPSMINVITEESNLYTIFALLGDAPFYFLPLLVGYTSAKYFGVSVPLGLLMGGVLLHPSMISIVQAGEAFTVYGIPMQLVDYSSSIVPVLLCVWVMSYVDKFFHRIIPDMLKMMLVHFCTMLVMIPLGLCILAPAGNIVSSAIGGTLIAIPNYIGPFGVAIVCFVWPLLVSVGMHMPIAMLALTTFFAVGHEDIIFMADSLQHFSAMGVALAFAMLGKSKENRSLGISSFVAMFLGGVIEPTLFGIAIPNRKYLLALLAGSGIGGLFAGVMKVGIYTLGTSNILNVISFSGGTTQNFIFGLIACLISFAGGLFAAVLLNGVFTKAKKN